MPNFLRILGFLASAFSRLRWDRKKLIEYQERRLRSVVKYAYRYVPFYHEKFKNAGINPNKIKTLDDLSKIPVIRKDEIRSVDINKLISMEYKPEKLNMHITSGSTGEPFKFYINRIEDDWRKSIYMRANISCGQRPRDRWTVITDPRHFYDTTDIQRRLGIFSQNCISIFNNLDEQIQKVRDAKTDILDGYSGALYLLSQQVKKQGVEDITPKLIFGSCDLIDSSSCRYLEKVFNAPYYDQYGCSEVDRTGWQCPEKIAFHMDVDSVITQFVDPDGSEVSPGERGEIVFTSLFNYAMPFIRYSVGDIGKPSDEICPCGRSLPLMEVIEGRKNSFIILPGKGVVSPFTILRAMSMFKYYDNIERFRIIQKKINHIDVLLKMKSFKFEEKSIEQKLISHLCRLMNLSRQEITFNVEFMEDIPLSKTGRLNAVISEIVHIR